MNIDFVFHHAQNAPANGWWEDVRGVESKKLQYQKELLIKSNKPDHLKFLTLKGETAEIRTAALAKWVDSGMKPTDITNVALDCKDEGARKQLIALLAKPGKQNPTALGYIACSTRREQESLLATESIIAIAKAATTGTTDAEKKVAKELSGTAHAVLEMVALTNGFDKVSMLAFKFLSESDKLKPKTAEKMKDGAMSAAVKKAARALL